jgi:hypothetical protein
MLIYCFGDEIRLYPDLGHYHIDVHAGNLFRQKCSVNNVRTATWADVGRTSFNQIHQSKPLLLSMMLTTIARAEEDKLDFSKEIAMQLEGMLLNYNSFNMSAARALIESYMERVELDTVVTGISPVVAKGFDILFTHMHNINNTIAEIQRDMVAIRRDHMKQNDAMSEIRRDMVAIRRDHMKQNDAMSDLRREVANLTQIVNLLLAQYSARPLSKIADDGDTVCKHVFDGYVFLNEY